MTRLWHRVVKALAWGDQVDEQTLDRCSRPPSAQPAPVCTVDWQSVSVCYLAASQFPDFIEETYKEEVGLRSVCAVSAICFALGTWV